MPNSQLNKDINRYIKEIKSLMICDFQTKRKFIKDFKSDLFEYIDCNSVSDISEVYEHFGSPQDISKAFFESADIRRIKRKMNIGKTLLLGVIIALVVWAVGVTATVIDDIFHPGYFVDETYNVVDGDEILEEREVYSEDSV